MVMLLSSPLRKLKTFMDIPTRKRFFIAYILPYFDYCCTIWGHASSEIKTRMFKLQKKCARYILDADISHPSIDLFRQLKWLPFENRVSFKTAVMMYKTIHGLNPRYMKSMLSFCTQRHDHHTRTSTSMNLVAPPVRIDALKNSFTFQGICLRNSLNSSLRMASSLHSLKIEYSNEQYVKLFCNPVTRGLGYHNDVVY